MTPVSQEQERNGVVGMTSEYADTTTFEKKREWVTRMAKKFSADFARAMAERGKVSEDEDLNKVYTFLMWKIDWFVDTYPDWNDELDPAGESVSTARLSTLQS